MARTFPTGRTSPFDPPAELADLPPISPLAYPDGHVGWLVTGHALAREVLSDTRFSAKFELRRRVVAWAGGVPAQTPPGFFLGMDPPEHTRIRKLLAGLFTAHRTQRLEPRIEEITRGQLALFREQGSPADLVEGFAVPVPLLVISELLGVEHADRADFLKQTRLLLDIDVPAEQATAARQAIGRFLYGLVLRKKAVPADDVLSDLIRAGELRDDELAGVGMVLLLAGHETTANMLGLGVMALLHDRTRWDALRDDPSLVDGAVEELLRYLTIVHFGAARTALVDVDLDGVRIRAGDAVSISLPAANRDREWFTDPDRLNVRESAHGHLAFGHGIHQCLGQHLARLELRIAFRALLRELPGLRLDLPESAIPMRDRMAVYGVHRLPVTW